jgi:hypothetical protein
MFYLPRSELAAALVASEGVPSSANAFVKEQLATIEDDASEIEIDMSGPLRAVLPAMALSLAPTSGLPTSTGPAATRAGQGGAAPMNRRARSTSGSLVARVASASQRTKSLLTEVRMLITPFS